MCVFIARLGAAGIMSFFFFSMPLCNKYALLSRNGLCREYALFWSCFGSDLTQTNEIWLGHDSDIWVKKWRVKPLDTPLAHFRRIQSDGQMAINGQKWPKWPFMAIWPSDHGWPFTISDGTGSDLFEGEALKSLASPLSRVLIKLQFWEDKERKTSVGIGI